MRVVRSARGAMLVERDAVLSVVLRRPEAAGCLFDVLAARRSRPRTEGDGGC
ncbi:MAG: hypothetical protein Q9Q13_01795 [Acidobacteriota bacterium]|nr:hypothetical protein [Acidobacteriota bacterium]